jgi:hypothetical protein
VNHIEASLCFPTFPRFCGQTFTEAQDKELALLCVKAYNDWMVEEWCGPDQRPAHPALPDPAVGRRAGRRRGAPQRRARRPGRLLQRDPALPRPALGPRPRPLLGPVLPACEETGTVINMHIGSSSKMPSTSADAPPPSGSTLTHSNATYSMVDFMFSGCWCGSPSSSWPTPRARSAGSPTSSSGPTRCGRRTGAGAAWPTSSPSPPRPTSTARSTAASSATPSA